MQRRVLTVLVSAQILSGGGLAARYLTGAIGSLGVIAAAVADNPVLLFVALFVYGAGTATNLQARYAGADPANPSHRGRAVSTVLVATTLGGIVGPNLAAPTGTSALALGIPSYQPPHSWHDHDNPWSPSPVQGRGHELPAGRPNAREIAYARRCPQTSAPAGTATATATATGDIRMRRTASALYR